MFVTWVLLRKQSWVFGIRGVTVGGAVWICDVVYDVLPNTDVRVASIKNCHDVRLSVKRDPGAKFFVVVVLQSSRTLSHDQATHRGLQLWELNHQPYAERASPAI